MFESTCIPLAAARDLVEKSALGFSSSISSCVGSINLFIITSITNFSYINDSGQIRLTRADNSIIPQKKSIVYYTQI